MAEQLAAKLAAADDSLDRSDVWQLIQNVLEKWGDSLPDKKPCPIKRLRRLSSNQGFGPGPCRRPCCRPMLTVLREDISGAQRREIIGQVREMLFSFELRTLGQAKLVLTHREDVRNALLVRLDQLIVRLQRGEQLGQDEQAAVVSCQRQGGAHSEHHVDVRQSECSRFGQGGAVGRHGHQVAFRVIEGHSGNGGHPAAAAGSVRRTVHCVRVGYMTVVEEHLRSSGHAMAAAGHGGRCGHQEHIPVRHAGCGGHGCEVKHRQLPEACRHHETEKRPEQHGKVTHPAQNVPSAQPANVVRCGCGKAVPCKDTTGVPQFTASTQRSACAEAKASNSHDAKNKPARTDQATQVDEMAIAFKALACNATQVDKASQVADKTSQSHKATQAVHVHNAVRVMGPTVIVMGRESMGAQPAHCGRCTSCGQLCQRRQT